MSYLICLQNDLDTEHEMHLAGQSLHELIRGLPEFDLPLCLPWSIDPQDVLKKIAEVETNNAAVPPYMLDRHYLPRLRKLCLLAQEAGTNLSVF